MKTAVEWYSDKLLDILGDKVNEFTQEQTLANHYALKQAKEMEKEQRQKDTNYGYSQGYDDGIKNLEPMKPELLTFKSE